MMSSERSILLVEDNDDDVILIQRALKKGGIDAPVHVARDGDEAVDFLSGAEQSRDAASLRFPTVVLLDLKLPKRNGFEVLQWIRSHRTLAQLPVVVFTTSTQDADLARAYGLGANSYLRKPATMGETTELLKTVGVYWLSYNECPPAIPRMP
jgi:CheY-like chemotaxis protein